MIGDGPRDWSAHGIQKGGSPRWDLTWTSEIREGGSFPFDERYVTSTGGYVVNGSTQFKSRLLRALGSQITHVPFSDWDD